VVVFGGDHADVRSNLTPGRMLATALVEHGFSSDLRCRADADERSDPLHRGDQHQDGKSWRYIPRHQLPYIAIPTGTAVTGRIAAAKPPGRLSVAAELSIELISVKLPSATGS